MLGIDSLSLSCFDTAFLTGTGPRRVNQDRAGFRVVDGTGCWIVADGLGGHGFGEVAAETAVQAGLRSFEICPSVASSALLNHFDECQAAILKIQQEQAEKMGMRTTAVILLADESSAWWGHVGDSRLYVFRQGRLFLRTYDHSVAQTLVRAGLIRESELRHHADRSGILKSLGGAGPAQPSVPAAPFTLESGDVFLLCTDGFWEQVLESEMEHSLASADSMSQWLECLEGGTAQRLRPHRDNYTALAVRIA